MTALTAAGLTVLMILTAILSGVFGMAGGLILIGVLLVLMPLPQAMVLHAITQMASNGWRAVLWRQHIEWRIAAASVAGSLAAVALWSAWLWVPDKAVALLLLGVSPFLVRAIPERVLPKVLGPGQMLVGSAICMMLMLTAGVTGPLLDTLFLRSTLDRKRIIATKAACQLFSHGLKLVYFGALVAFFHVPIPVGVDSMLQFLQSAAAPVALFALGVTVALRPFERMPWELPGIIAIKLIAHPLIVFGLLIALGPFPPQWAAAALLLASLPPALNVFVIARQYDTWIEPASAAVLIGTFVSVVTLTSVMWLIRTGAIVFP